MGLVGTIPSPNGWALPARMQHLELGRNNISGPIPPGWRLPEGAMVQKEGGAGCPYWRQAARICSHSPPGHLHPDLPSNWSAGVLTLYLSFAPLGGSLPGNWALPDSLEVLALSNCGLGGQMPADWSVPAFLRNVDLSNNSLMGTIPKAFTQISTLQVLAVQNNRLTGVVGSLSGQEAPGVRSCGASARAGGRALWQLSSIPRLYRP